MQTAATTNNTNVFSTENAKVNWKIINSRVEPRSMTIDMLQPKLKDLVRALTVVGVIGSSLMKDVFFKKNKKYLSIAKDYGIIEEHQLIRNNQIIPIYTLGVTGVAIQKQLGGTKPLNYWQNYSVNDVMKCIVTYQLFNRYRQMSDTYLEDIASFTPFQAEFASPHAKGIAKYAVGVMLCDEDVKSFEIYLRMGQELPNRMIFIVNDLRHMKKLESVVLPYSNKIMVVLDKDLKMDCEFKKLFHSYNIALKEWI